jgi:hypothetical protein
MCRASNNSLMLGGSAWRIFTCILRIVCYARSAPMRSVKLPTDVTPFALVAHERWQSKAPLLGGNTKRTFSSILRAASRASCASSASLAARRAAQMPRIQRCVVIEGGQRSSLLSVMPPDAAQRLLQVDGWRQM